MITRWYKEPWAWLVFFLPFSAVVAGIATYIIANDDPDPLVVGEYYKKGKAINQELKKIKLAEKLGMKFDLQFNQQTLVIKPTGIEKAFPMLNINFYHSTLADKDFYLALTPDANGLYRQHIEHNVDGKWRITISSFENTWKIENVVSLPQSQFIEIKPDINQAN
ncbi:MAG: FixH family protein [Thalassotalea sp.]